MSVKLKYISLILLLFYFDLKCECGSVTRKRGPPLRKQANLPSNEIDPDVSPVLHQSGAAAVASEAVASNTVAPTTLTGAVSEQIDSIAQQAASTADIAETNAVESVANAINPIEEINANNTVLDPVDGLTSSVASSSGASSASSSSSASPASSSSSSTSSSTTTNVDDPNPISKLCKCTDTSCNCCRDFALPLVPIKGPGCARIHYLGNERMSVQIKYGDIVLAQRTINGKKAPPVCVGLPGGYTKFCARVYGLSKEKSGFKSCLSLELRAEDELEAQLRVSCFRFSDKGLTVTEAEPVPQIETEKDEEDDDDIFGLGGGGDDEDEDYDDGDDDDDDDEESEDAGASEDTDYDFRFLTDVFGSEEKKPKNKAKITVVSNANNDYAQFKDVEDAIGGQNIPSTYTASNTTDNIQTKPNKSKAKNSKKKKDNDDEYESLTDVFYAVISNFF